MDFQNSQSTIELVVPALLGGTLCLLALVGIRELLQETSVAIKKQIKA